jgi:hypothetical protein
MKKTTCRVIGVILLLGLAFSCQHEMPESIKPDDAAATNTHNNKKNAANARLSFQICLRNMNLGQGTPGTNPCRPGHGICSPGVELFCFYKDYPLPWPDPCLSCPPWKIVKDGIIDPEYFDLPQDLERIDILNSMTVFPINDHIVALQFYAPIEGILDEKSITLKSSLPLTENTIKDFGLKGTVVPSGVNFPVIYNSKNKTYNAIVSVENFPLNYDSPVAEIKPAHFEGSLDNLFKDYYLNEYPNAVLQETPESFQISSVKLDGRQIFLFSPDGESLGLLCYGIPTPQPAIVLKNTISLDEEIADILKIKSFELKPENLYQSFDKKTGALTVLIAP